MDNPTLWNGLILRMLMATYIPDYSTPTGKVLPFSAQLTEQGLLIIYVYFVGLEGVEPSYLTAYDP